MSFQLQEWLNYNYIHESIDSHLVSNLARYYITSINLIPEKIISVKHHATNTKPYMRLGLWTEETQMEFMYNS